MKVPCGGFDLDESVFNVDKNSKQVKLNSPISYDYMPEGYPKKDGWSVEWDGNIDGKVAVAAPKGGQFYKFSDMVLSVDDLLGAMVTFPDFPGKNHSLPADEIQQISEVLIGVKIFDGVFIVKKDNVYWNGATFPEKGLYTIGRTPRFMMSKENITPMSTDFLPKNLNVVFRGELGHAPTSCNVTYNELRDWVERDIPVFAVFIAAIAKFNITGTALLTDSLGFVYYNDAGASKFFKYNSDGTFIEGGGQG